MPANRAYAFLVAGVTFLIDQLSKWAVTGAARPDR